MLRTIPTFQSPFLTWLIFIMLIVSCIMALWAFYYWWKKDHYRREKFAFVGFTALVSLCFYYITCVTLNKSIITGLLRIASKPFGIDIPVKQLTPIETLLGLGIIGILTYAYTQIFKHWSGQKSIAHHEQIQNQEVSNFLKAIALLLKRDEKLALYQEELSPQNAILDKPETLAWHERARQLWVLRNRTYLFTDENQYDPSRKCWIGLEKNTNALVLFACYHDIPPKSKIEELSQYAKKISINQNKIDSDIELIIAVKNKITEENKIFLDDCIIKYTSEDELLDKLVDFSDYFADIDYRVERAKLIDSDLTLQDTYSPSSYKLKKDGEPQSETLENFILSWLQDNTHKQLALLGEYGQGKSTSSLLVSYKLIKQLKEKPDNRIPILIELRGKTLRTLPPEELLATWAYRYSINVQALMHLHMAGRLLLIFEGFDEIDLSGDTEARVNHFRSLWRMNYEHSKIMITGRPNFFLDSNELKRSLGNKEQTQTIYIAPFNIDQISNSLRFVNHKVKNEIISLAKKDQKFCEVVARPSLLYIVSILWHKKELSKRKNINSAVVIDLFIQQTLQRQQDKNDERPFMALNSAERHYFMTGIAAYMTAKKLPNQIDKHQLDEAVQKLVEIIPESVSQNVSSVNNEVSYPLRSEKRFEWKTRREEIINKINTDVRSCGLLVSDLSKDGTFKFAHKSFMELLQAQVISYLFVEDKLKSAIGRSLANTWKLKIEDLQNSDESISFLAEFLTEKLSDSGKVKESDIVIGLFEILVVGKKAVKHSFLNFFNSLRIMFLCRLANRLILRFGFNKLKKFKFYGIIFPPLFLLTLLMIIHGGLDKYTLHSLLLFISIIFIFVTVFHSSIFMIDSIVNIVSKEKENAFIIVIKMISSLTSVILIIYLNLTISVVLKFLEEYTSYDYFSVTISINVFSLSMLYYALMIYLFIEGISINNKIQTWHHACQNLGFKPENIYKVIGKEIFSLPNIKNSDE